MTIRKLFSKIFLFFCFFIFVSCQNLYFSTFDDSELKSKNTIKTFDHLNEPIVISLPVCDTLTFCGNKDWGSRVKRLGDIVAVLDVETETVYDWIYYQGDHGWSNWRWAEAEIGDGQTVYVMASAGLGQAAVLDPKKNQLSVYKTEAYDYHSSQKCNNQYVPIGVANSKTYDIHLFNAKTGEVNGIFSIPTDSVGYIDFFKCDKKGNFYFTACLEKVFSLYKIDVEDKELVKYPQKFEMYTKIGDELEEQADFYSVGYVSEDYIFINRYPAGYDTHPHKLYLLNKETHKIEKEMYTGAFIYDIQYVDGKYYGISSRWNDDGSHSIFLYELDIEKMTSTKLDLEIIFDFTECIYTRGSRLYFMNSRNTSDIKYIYYDVVTGEVGNEVRVSVKSILASMN